MAPAHRAEPQAVVGATSRKQATVLFDIVRGFADGLKQHGLILSLAIVDELHAHRDGELYTALRTQPTFVVDPEQAGELVAQQIEDRLPGACVMTHSQAPSGPARGLAPGAC